MMNISAPLEEELGGSSLLIWEFSQAEPAMRTGDGDEAAFSLLTTRGRQTMKKEIL